MTSSRPHLRVHYLPQFVPEHELAGSTVVVIDLLRASSTICAALAAGAQHVVTYLHEADALAAADAGDRSQVLLGGERGGQRIEGFDLGNSPTEYTADVVFGRRILFTTTNGTLALHHARLAERVLVGAIVNLSAVVASIQDSPQVDLLCAGTGGHVTREDILAAGAMVQRLVAGRRGKDVGWAKNEAADSAAREWEELVTAARTQGRTTSDGLAHELRDTTGGKNLIRVGLEDDLAVCAQIDKLAVVPELDIKAWRITLP